MGAQRFAFITFLLCVAAVCGLAASFGLTCIADEQISELLRTSWCAESTIGLAFLVTAGMTGAVLAILLAWEEIHT